MFGSVAVAVAHSSQNIHPFFLFHRVTCFTVEDTIVLDNLKHLKNREIGRID